MPRPEQGERDSHYEISASETLTFNKHFSKGTERDPRTVGVFDSQKGKSNSTNSLKASQTEYKDSRDQLTASEVCFKGVSMPFGLLLRPVLDVFLVLHFDRKSI